MSATASRFSRPLNNLEPHNTILRDTRATDQVDNSPPRFLPQCLKAWPVLTAGLQSRIPRHQLVIFSSPKSRPTWAIWDPARPNNCGSSREWLASGSVGPTPIPDLVRPPSCDTTATAARPNISCKHHLAASNLRKPLAQRLQSRNSYVVVVAWHGAKPNSRLTRDKLAASTCSRQPGLRTCVVETRDPVLSTLWAWRRLCYRPSKPSPWSLKGPHVETNCLARLLLTTAICRGHRHNFPCRPWLDDGLGLLLDLIEMASSSSLFHRRAPPRTTHPTLTDL
ncbi:uncharacterized protein J3D65DRAFT_116814 [Phyllosticta citribraziliensis]|uniref:Uncharacterized protein n=1 Tax=Phyllosticta citribraziliensis TaxID=989973 RepID=A0ABR1LCB1_9PEZI